MYGRYGAVFHPADQCMTVDAARGGGGGVVSSGARL